MNEEDLIAKISKAVSDIKDIKCTPVEIVLSDKYNCFLKSIKKYYRIKTSIFTYSATFSFAIKYINTDGVKVTSLSY